MYEHYPHTGQSIVVEGNDHQCVNLLGDRYFNDKTSSADTHGGCVVLYEYIDCTGQ